MFKKEPKIFVNESKKGIGLDISTVDCKYCNHCQLNTVKQRELEENAESLWIMAQYFMRSLSCCPFWGCELYWIFYNEFQKNTVNDNSKK